MRAQDNESKDTNGVGLQSDSYLTAQREPWFLISFHFSIEGLVAHLFQLAGPSLLLGHTSFLFNF